MRAAENRRLLPDVANAVHIIDGPASRYYLGFVDIFTKYGSRQKLGQALKTVREPDKRTPFPLRDQIDGETVATFYPSPGKYYAATNPVLRSLKGTEFFNCCDLGFVALITHPPVQRCTRIAFKNS